MRIGGSTDKSLWAFRASAWSIWVLCAVLGCGDEPMETGDASFGGSQGQIPAGQVGIAANSATGDIEGDATPPGGQAAAGMVAPASAVVAPAGQAMGEMSAAMPAAPGAAATPGEPVAGVMTADPLGEFAGPTADATQAETPTDAEPGGSGTFVDAGVAEATPSTAEQEDLGEGDGSDVITIGDSWMTMYGGGIQGGLRAAGKRYRNYGIAGTTLRSSIPPQYTRAKRENPTISTVIMTGGGNDVMFSGGCNTTERCEDSVMEIQRMLGELWTEMSDDGVKDVIYVNYASDAATAPSGTRPTEPPPPLPICVNGPIRCHSLQTTDLVMGQLPDGIHPSGAAHRRIADALITLMEERGIRR